jgi:outer membrane receptor protein involved in Fe transport
MGRAKIKQCAMYALFAISGGISVQIACAEALNRQIPKQQEETFSVPVNIDIPQQPLATSLHALGKATGMSISFPNDIVSGKTAPEVRGRMTRQEALRRMLGGSELTTKVEGDNVFIQKAPKTDNKSVQLDKVEVRAKRFYEVGPLPGLGLTKEEIPGNVQSISAEEIKQSHSLSITDLMNRKLQSVNVNDYQGNPFQMDLTYRGFTAGPQIGTPQGLSVFFDGIRVNEPFGDVVNWDMIPMNALAGIDVFPGSNPIFGRNTLGGALSMKTKDGFNNEGVDAQVLAGSFGRKYLQAEGGWNNGTIGLFGAGNFFLEDGWRTNSPSKVNQFFGKASYRGDKLDLNLSTLMVKTELVGNGLVPSQMYEQDNKSVFTGEDTTKNTLSQFQLSGSYFVNDSFSVTGQVYRRNSNRHALGADAYMDGYPQSQVLLRNLNAGEQVSCQFLSTNQYGIPDYYVFALSDPFDGTSNPLIQDYIANNGSPGYNYETALASAKNGELSAEYAKAARESFIYWSNPRNQALYQYANIPVPEQTGTPLANGEYTYNALGDLYDFYRAASSNFDPTVGIEASLNYFYDSNGVKHVVIPVAPLNRGVCEGAQVDLVDTTRSGNGTPVTADGAGAQNASGQIDGVPTAVLTDNQIKQQTDGGSVQFNWNLDNHKLMVGASIDSAFASYSNSQRFGLLDENRKAYLAPDQILDMYTAADSPISNNNFSGTSTTKSIYASDTWSPIDTLHITAAARYNDTQVKNKVATRTAYTYYGLGSYVSTPDTFNLCVGSAANCPSTGYNVGDGTQLLKPAETEKFSYYSLNPSLGLSWQAKENLNFYVNLAQGTRTPSVVELGCAYDGRPSGQTVPVDRNGDGVADEFIDVPNSLAQNRSCTLPTTLSGDPYLPQIKATTYDIGFRGTIGENMQWNVGAYQTDLRDDIYLVTVGAANSFFDTIGKTRRRGIEAGISGKLDRLGFGVNYSLTDATFQSTFDMISDNNSSAVTTDLSSALAAYNGEAFKSITVKPGDRMPGIPLHNLNMNLSYELTDKWRAGFSAVMHSGSFVRGNENNKHQEGAAMTRVDSLGNIISSRVASNPGSVNGYAVVNFQTSYQINKEWSATFLVNNIFDKEYFTAGRLGLNPFSPSVYGAVDRSGYNHNSDDWLSTNFLAPGAPRAAWFSLRYQFVPDKQ